YAVTRRAPAAASARRRAARAARSADPFGAHYDHGRVTRIDRRPRGDRLPTREIDPVYTEFFGLNEKPFSITPDPRYLFLSRRHADALAHLIYGISESGGFIQLTGEVGTGKTTLIRSVLEQLPEKAEIALILNPQLTAREFIENICEELGMPIPAGGSLRALIAALNRHLLDRKSTRLNSSHVKSSYAVFCLKK